MTRKVAVGLRSLVGAALIAYVGWAAAEQAGYRRAVRAQAAARGLDPDSLSSPAHWPLDYYAPRLKHVAGPADAERVVTDADSIRYFRLAVGSSDNTALVQAFFFRVGPRTGVVQVDYRDCAPTAVDGADWLPRAEATIPRERALAACP